MTKKKQRLDLLLVERGLVETRSQGQVLVMAGEVRVDGATAVKPSTLVSQQATIEVVAPAPYVSLGGYKLAAALSQFNIDVIDEVCADVGACTGGFTDVLLQEGAARVYAIDVGYGQIDWRLRQDSRVVVMERTNARHLESLPELIGVVTIDVSFISLRLILPSAVGWLTEKGQIVALIKPQFEAGPASVGKGGVVRSTAVHQHVLRDVLAWCIDHDLAPCGLIRSPITGTEGNIEFLVWLRRGQEAALVLESAINSVIA